MAGPTPVLRLRSGLVIEDPLADAQRFIEVDGTYQGYDALPAGGDELTEADIWAANRMIARMGAADAEALLGRRDQIRDALIAIPASASLADDSVPWRELESLYVAVDGLRGIGLARATKVLHKKRPALIPILDEVVARYLAGVDGAVDSGPSTGETATSASTSTRPHQPLRASRTCSPRWTATRRASSGASTRRFVSCKICL